MYEREEKDSDGRTEEEEGVVDEGMEGTEEG